MYESLSVESMRSASRREGCQIEKQRFTMVERLKSKGYESTSGYDSIELQYILDSTAGYRKVRAIVPPSTGHPSPRLTMQLVARAVL
jgi:hypothetical protein